MKVAISLLAFLFISNLTNAQWYLQNPLPQGNNLNDVDFATASIGWAVGDMGTILKTTDGGNNWLILESGTENWLNGVSFSDLNHGTGVGWYGTVIRTTDGGITWSLQSSGITNHLFSVSFTDLNNGTAVGSGGVIIRTSDGGISWSLQISGTTNGLYSVYFNDTNNGIAVGSFGTIIRTSDGGLNWISQISGTTNMLRGISLTDVNNGWIAGDRIVLRTTDGGTTWIPRTPAIELLTDVSFIDANTGTVVGPSHRIYRTTNGGTIWMFQPIEAFPLLGVSFIDVNNGTAVGNGGTILRTTNGGSIWFNQTSIISTDLSAVAFTDPNNGTVVGGGTTILKTTDAGNTWNIQLSGGFNGLYDVSFTDIDNGTTVGSGGTILRTTNGGTNWISQSSGITTELTSVSFTNENTGTAVGFNGVILRTSNGGITWNQQIIGTTEWLLGVWFTDENFGTAVGSNGVVLRTSNGGITWIQQTSGTNNTLYGVHFVDENYGIIVGDGYPATILRTTNGGNTWTSHPSSITNFFFDVYLIDVNNGWAVGSGGITAKTTDGGINWISQSTGTNNDLHGVFFSDVNNGWTVGNWATILKYGITTQEQFTEQTSISLTNVGDGSVAWGDYDNDSDLDILLCGQAYDGSGAVSKIYRNNGNNSFTEQTSVPLIGVVSSDACWGDYDNDGYLDLLLTGWSGAGGMTVTKVYHNNGDNSFTEQTSISLSGVTNGSVAWGDYDNDGYLDILLTGATYVGVPQLMPISKVYHNNGDNTFIEQTQISLQAVVSSSVAWGDYDNDGDLDILLTGWNGSADISKIYRNDGNNIFTEQSSIALIGVDGGSVAWGDYDNDSYLDIILTGTTIGGNFIEALYRNNGNNTFTLNFSQSYAGVSSGAVAWGDYDNDGDLDIVIIGKNSVGNMISRISKNNGDNTFTNQSFQTFINVYYSSVAWGDYDNDGDLDILLSGLTSNNSDPVSKIYRNNNISANTLPSVPTNFTTTINGSEVTFNWDKSTDNETPQNGLKYNLVIGTNPNAVNTLSPMSDRTSGYRRVINLGNTNHNNSWSIKGLESGTYYWSVQAIDNNFAGSNFAPEHSFVIDPTTFPLSVSVSNDWNMVSVPGFHPTNQNVTTWWPYLTGTVWGYNGVQYFAAATATPGEGYWMRNVGAMVYNYPAILIVPHIPINAVSGWNIIGGYEDIVATNTLTTSPPMQMTGTIWGYNGSQYVPANTIVPGYSYWVRLLPGCPCTINIPDVLVKGNEVVELFKEDWGRIILTDAAGISSTLYAVKGEVDLEQYEMPPLPPAGSFDVRYSSGRIAEDLSSIQTIDMTSVQYPIAVTVENMTVRLMDETGKQLNENVEDGKRIVIHDSKINKLKVTGELIPTVYALEQNYPNPFNPTTTIEFSLPEDVHSVKLTIYNALGERVAALVNGSLTAGKYSYKWNAKNVATGMYIYELRTEKFVSVKKMILLK